MSPSTKSLAQRLRERGFDQSEYDRSSGHTRVKCSQCQALVINGIATHERGCPNDKKDEDETDD